MRLTAKTRRTDRRAHDPDAGSSEGTDRVEAVLLAAGVPARRVSKTARKIVEALSIPAQKPRVRPAPGTIIDLRPITPALTKRRTASETRLRQASNHYERGLSLESSDLDAARVAYTAALATYGEHLDARINLGRLFHLHGDLAAAEKAYRAAKSGSAILSYNLALLLEDLRRDEEAARSYRDALALDPEMHEAHFNLGLLHERLERPREALRHMLAYRRRMSK